MEWQSPQINSCTEEIRAQCLHTVVHHGLHLIIPLKVFCFKALLQWSKEVDHYVQDMNHVVDGTRHPQENRSRNYVVT